MTERHLPMDINYKYKTFDNNVREELYLAAWKDIDKLVEVMQGIGIWDTIVTVVE